jgi:hypothetical protein
VTLGSCSAGEAVLGFDGTSGVAAWITAPHTLAVQPLARDGGKVGNAAAIAVPADVEPEFARAVGAEFVVLLRRWDEKAQHTSWWAVMVAHDGRAGTAVPLALDDLEVGVIWPLDDGRLALDVSPAFGAEKGMGTWSALAIGSAGGITIEGEPASAPRGPPADEVRGYILNTDPSQLGPLGVYTGVLRPVFMRSQEQDSVGRPIELVAHGSTIPIAQGDSKLELAWSGTHFLYQFVDGEGAHLLPIDCRPSRRPR